MCLETNDIIAYKKNSVNNLKPFIITLYLYSVNNSFLNFIGTNIKEDILRHLRTAYTRLFFIEISTNFRKIMLRYYFNFFINIFYCFMSVYEKFLSVEIKELAQNFLYQTSLMPYIPPLFLSSNIYSQYYIHIVIYKKTNTIHLLGL